MDIELKAEGVTSTSTSSGSSSPPTQFTETMDSAEILRPDCDERSESRKGVGIMGENYSGG